jgi:hypothetical protein
MSQSDQPPTPAPSSALWDPAAQTGTDPGDAARLERDILEFARRLKRDHGSQYRRDRKGFTTRAVRYLKRALRPRRRVGAKRSTNVTKAYGMWRDRLRASKFTPGLKVNWYPIAFACIPGYRDMDGTQRRRRLRNLQNSVYNRAYREKAKVRIGRGT